MATECSWNDGSKTQYYVVILDWLPGRSGGLERAPEWCVRGPLTGVLRRTQNIPRTRSREKMQMQLRQALERTAGWESLARCTLGLHHTCKVQCWGYRQGGN